MFIAFLLEIIISNETERKGWGTLKLAAIMFHLLRNVSQLLHYESSQQQQQQHYNFII